MYSIRNILFFFLLGISVSFSACKSQREVSMERPAAKEEKPVEKLRQLESTALMIDATRQQMLGNWSNALVKLSQAVKADPNNAAAYYELAKIHAQQGHLTDAESFAQKAAALEPDNKWYKLLLADIYFLREKNTEGLEVQAQLARDNPNDISLQVSYLSSLIYTQSYSTAIAQIDHIESISGFSDEMSLQKQKLYMVLGKHEEAIREAEKLISYYPQETVYLELLAELYEEANKPEMALETYHRILEVQPDNAMARLLLADYYRKKGDDARSFEELKKAFLSPNFTVEGKARIMYTFYQLSEQDTMYLRQAYQLCHILLEMHPEDPEAHALYGDFLYRDEKLESARYHFYRAAKLAPSELRFWQQALFIDSRLENYEDMLSTSEEALDYFFEQPVIFLFNGLANYQKKQYDDAISAFRHGRDLSIADPELQAQFLTLLGDSYHKAGNHIASDNAYEEALKLDPTNAVALNNYSYQLSLRNTRLNEALKMSAKALEMEPENAAFQDTFGWIKYMMGNYTEAKYWIAKSLQQSDTPGATVLEHMGDVYFRLGEKESALLYWQKALDAARENGDEGSEFLQKKVRDKKLYE